MLNLKSPILLLPSQSRSLQNPNPKSISPIFPPILSPKPRFCHPFICRGGNGVQPSLSSNGPTTSSDRHGGIVDFKRYDVATLGNLCVDVVLNVSQLPPKQFEQRQNYMEILSKCPPDKKHWEAGGNCNTAIAAARLGLNCVTIGHVGNEIYGDFLLDVLRDEGIDLVGLSDDAAVDSSSLQYQTLLCWVLVDSMQRHGFLSRADFIKEPAFSWVNELPGKVKAAIRNSKILFVNGYGFDDLSPGVIMSVLKYAVEVGTSVFFDPGPRGRSLANGTSEEQRALDQLLRMSDVLLLTSDEAEALTKIQHPVLAGQELLRRGMQTKWVIIKTGSRGSILITPSTISCAPAFKVSVVDTVGCGDSFVAAIAYAYIHNLPEVNTLALANAVGAATAMGCGAGRNVATLEKVLELMKVSKLNHDDKFWCELLGEDLDAEDITILSKMIINGNNNKLNHVIFEKVVSGLIYKLESQRLKGMVPS